RSFDIICGHEIECFFINCSSDSIGLSPTMLIISKFDLEVFSYSSLSVGISSIHGAHQVAQKSNRTYFPFKSSKEIEMSFLNCLPENLIALKPICVEYNWFLGKTILSNINTFSFLFTPKFLKTSF